MSVNAAIVGGTTVMGTAGVGGLDRMVRLCRESRRSSRRKLLQVHRRSRAGLRGMPGHHSHEGLSQSRKGGESSPQSEAPRQPSKLTEMSRRRSEVPNVGPITRSWVLDMKFEEFVAWRDTA